MGALSNLGFTENHLGNAGAITQVNEDNTAVVATARHPTCQGDGLPRHLFAQFACQMCTQHSRSIPSHR